MSAIHFTLLSFHIEILWVLFKSIILIALCNRSFHDSVSGNTEDKKRFFVQETTKVAAVMSSFHQLCSLLFYKHTVNKYWGYAFVNKSKTLEYTRRTAIFIPKTCGRSQGQLYVSDFITQT